MAGRAPLVGIVMGSASDWEVMREAAKQLADFSVPYEAKVLSAHRSPDALAEWVERLSAKGVRCFMAGAANAGLFAVAMLAQGDAKLAERLAQFRAGQAEAVKNAKLPD